MADAEAHDRAMLASFVLQEQEAFALEIRDAIRAKVRGGANFLVLSKLEAVHVLAAMDRGLGAPKPDPAQRVLDVLRECVQAGDGVPLQDIESNAGADIAEAVAAWVAAGMPRAGGGG